MTEPVLGIVTAMMAASGAAPQALTAQTRLLDLGLQSLDVLQLIFDLEERLGMQLPENVVDNLVDMTIGDLVNVIERVREGTWAPAA